MQGAFFRVREGMKSLLLPCRGGTGASNGIGSGGEALKEKIFLIIAASIGSGHMKAAEAVADELKIISPKVSIHVVDFSDWRVSSMTALMKAGYLGILRFIPNLYDLMYRFTGGKAGGLSVQSLISAVISRDFSALLRKYQPDMVICTHPFPAGAASWRKQRHPEEFRFATVITDYSVHQMWIYPNPDLYFVARESMKTDLIAAGLASERIIVTGIPVSARFRHREDRTAVLESLGLSSEMPVVLLMGGGLGLGGVEFALGELDKIDRPMQFLVVAGRNEALRERVEKKAASFHHPLITVGFSSRVSEFMAASTILISKPGALTISEALSLELPMILHDPIPGPETQNAVYMARNGTAVWVNHEKKLLPAVSRLLSEPGVLAEMQHRAHEMKRPYAARDIARELVIAMEKHMDLQKIQGR